MDPTTSHTTYRDGAGRVRTAHFDDLPGLDALMMRTDAFVPWLRPAILRSLDREQLLVLDDDGVFRAAALVGNGGGQRSHVELLLIAPEAMGRGLEQRMVGVADALHEAFEDEVHVVVPVERDVLEDRT